MTLHRLVHAAALFLFCTAPALSQAPGTARVEATYTVDPREPGAERALKELTRHIERRAPRVLAPGQKLSVALVSVYRAGHRSWTPGNDGMRVITDSSPARIDLSFSLRDASDALVAEGSRSLRSPAYFVADRGGDPLRFEKDLLDDWLAREFEARK